jgi:hypothetical protein
VFYRHSDRLGSLEAMTTGAAHEYLIEAHGYDAFGKTRGREWQPSGDRLHPNGDGGAVTEQGFTKHEHLDDTYLIHMNGRVYDHRLGRFLSVATQSFPIRRTASPSIPTHTSGTIR